MSTHTIAYEGISLEYELIRKDIKYINLRVNKKGEVVVSAPEHAPLPIIEEFVQSKTLWIITHLAEVEKIKTEHPYTGFCHGKTVYYLGKPYRLVLEKGEKQIYFTEDTLHMVSDQTTEHALREEYLLWLKKQAELHFAEVLDQVLPLVAPLGIARPTVQVRNMRTLWGSCSTKRGAIRLNLQLMKAPRDCTEQVILHELLHFRYPNHGKEFYQALEGFLPDWKARKSRLESNYKDGV